MLRFLSIGIGQAKISSNLRKILFIFIEKNFPEEIADCEKGEDDDGDDNGREFVEGKEEDAKRPEESEPEERILFGYFPFETHIEITSEGREDEGKEKEQKEKFGQAETRGDEGRQEHLDREERHKAEVADDEGFEEQGIGYVQKTVSLPFSEYVPNLLLCGFHVCSKCQNPNFPAQSGSRQGGGKFQKKLE